MRVLTKQSTSVAKSHLIYGETQSGKTTLIGLIARAHYQRTGKITRLIICDEGGPSAIQSEITDGIIEVVDMVGDDQPRSNLMWLAKGAWPSPVTGAIDQKSKLPENVGIVVLDSLTSAAALVMNNFIQSGTKISQDVVAAAEEQGLKFGVAAPSHYGAVHGFILQLITQMSSLPVDKVIFTALESKAEDIIDKQTILGPAIVGKALTGVIPSRMNRILHLEIVPSADRKTRQYRIYFMPHVDQTIGRVWPANLRLPLPVVQSMKTDALYGKGYLDFQTGEELLGLFDYCETAVAPKPVPAPTVIDPEVKGIDTVVMPITTPPTSAQRIASLTNKGIYPANQPKK